MPYNPMVQDRRGELMAQGISQFAGGVASLGPYLDKLAEKKEEKEKEEKFQLGLKKALKPRWQELGFESEAQYENSDTMSIVGLAKGAIESAGIQRHEQERKLSAAKLDELRQAQGARQGFNADLTKFLTGPYDVQPPLAPDQARNARLTPEGLLRMGAENQLSIEDQARMSGVLENLAQSGEGRNRVPAVVEIGGRKMAYSPHTGQFQLLEDEGSPEAKPIKDPSGKEIPGLAWINKQVVKTGGDTTARDTKLTLDTLVNAEKALRDINNDIRNWRYNDEESKRDRKAPKPDPKELQGLERRRARLQAIVDSAGGEDEPPASADAPAAPLTLKSKAEVDKLPKGTEYMWGGKKYRKK